MKGVKMKGKNKEEAVKAALEVLGGSEAEAVVKVLNEGRSGMLGIGGEAAEVEVTIREGRLKDSIQVLQEILDKGGFLSMVEGTEDGERINLNVKGEDMGRVIGKEGATLKALGILTSTIISRTYAEKVRISIDAEGYREKRTKALERLAKEAADEVAESGQEKVLPYMEAADRRAIHMFIAENDKVKTYSQGEGRDRRLVIAPK